MIHLARMLMSVCVSLTLTTAKAQETVAISKGEKAPFSGVIMPENTFNEVNADLAVGEEIARQNSLCQTDKTNCLDSKVKDQIVWFGAGAGFGLVMTLVIKSALK